MFCDAFSVMGNCRWPSGATPGAWLDGMISSQPIRRWFRVTPGRLIVALFVLEAFLFLSDRFRWLGSDN
jgi:hypothetical protein